ncbi:hypothetical protein L226DRAFT_474435, partial [Lentinus tigrinus ALCF2SS1-7]|uniref:uncharacterized protein n=1 Tax=Lentinus tigrinus ALCF2SS1-7 TaxID=1328758 RepID=UPI0011663238
AVALANETSFRNCLIVMRPQTRKSELPSRTTIRTRITNDYAAYLDCLVTDIKATPGRVSVLWDLCTAPHTSTPYLRMIETWINVNSTMQTWTMRSKVTTLHEILRKHSGVNLGHYFILFLDCAGIMFKKHSKVCCSSTH